MTITLPARRLVSQESQSMVERADIPRSRFTNQWTRKTTFNAGDLIPILVDELLPGDHVRYNVSAYLRMGTLLFPQFDNQVVETFFFFVPNRIVWSNWVGLMGEQVQPSSPAPDTYSVPYTDSPAGGFAINSLFDHMGLPTVGQVTAGQVVRINCLPIRAYRLICNTWFRDENIVDWGGVAVDNGPDLSTAGVIRRRAKAHDYFTTALPWPQKFTAPTALGTQAPVLGLGVATTDTTTAGPLNVRGAATASNPTGVQSISNWISDAGGTLYVAGASVDGPLAVYADLSQITVNTLRLSFMTQALLERDARGGTRYVEIIKSHFGVTSPDFRLQRPEYIGGGSSPLNISPVAQTATGGSGVGALAGAGTSFGQHSASYAATEHGYVIGIINVRSELSYQQGIHKMWSRFGRYDFYWPSLALLGEQAVLRQEIYATGVDADDATVFGYQERWHEYRVRMSEVTGMFRSTSAGNIDEWHLAEQFGAAPTLNETFITEPPSTGPVQRVLAAGAAAANMQYLASILFQRDIVRPMPAFSTPAKIGRF